VVSERGPCAPGVAASAARASSSHLARSAPPTGAARGTGQRRLVCRSGGCAASTFGRALYGAPGVAACALSQTRGTGIEVLPGFPQSRGGGPR